MIRRFTRADEGFTLVELIVYSAILMLVMGIGATLLVRTITAQRDTMSIAEANNLAQLTFKELESDLRNASMAQIADGGNLMVMQTRRLLPLAVDRPAAARHVGRGHGNQRGACRLWLLIVGLRHRRLVRDPRGILQGDGLACLRRRGWHRERVETCAPDAGGRHPQRPQAGGYFEECVAAAAGHRGSVLQLRRLR